MSALEIISFKYPNAILTMNSETNMEGIVRRVKMVFHDRTYQRRLKTTDKKWMDDKMEDILNGLITFLENCEKITVLIRKITNKNTFQN